MSRKWYTFSKAAQNYEKSLFYILSAMELIEGHLRIEYVAFGIFLLEMNCKFVLFCQNLVQAGFPIRKCNFLPFSWIFDPKICEIGLFLLKNLFGQNIIFMPFLKIPKYLGWVLQEGGPCPIGISDFKVWNYYGRSARC